MEYLLMVAAFIAIFYFMIMRPAQKRVREQQSMQDSIESGTKVVLTSGIHATVRHLGDTQMILELAPGVEVTAAKGAIARVISDDDEEFAFDDEPSNATPQPLGQAWDFAADPEEPGATPADITPVTDLDTQAGDAPDFMAPDPYGAPVDPEENRGN